MKTIKMKHFADGHTEELIVDEPAQGVEMPHMVKPFAELPAKMAFTDADRSKLAAARAVLERARELQDSDTLARAETALWEVLEWGGYA